MERGGQLPARSFWTAALAFFVVAVTGLVGVDEMLAGWLSAHPADAFWNWGTGLPDILVLKEISNLLLGALLLGAAAVLLAMRGTRRFGWPTLYVALVQFTATVAADLAKPPLGRLRPFEAAAQPGGLDTWFVGANSFPSGHTAFYAGLFFPLMLLFPRLTLLFALPPAFIALARVLVNDHYLSDVAASLALAAALTAALAPLAVRATAVPSRRGRTG